jgi:hypothetical protein
VDTWKNCWDCPAEAAALGLFLVIAALAPWAAAKISPRLSVTRSLVMLLSAFGVFIWLVQIIYIPGWGIRLHETPRDTAVVYGGDARLLMGVAAALLLGNLGAAWASFRRA